MTREDLQKLVGGYATGSLTEAEKKALFEAALDDQELFDEIAREQPLKEILDQPGARARLIAALAEKPKAAWWQRPIAWSFAAAAAVVVIAGTWMIEHRPQPVEVAQVPSAPAVEATPAPAAPAPVEKRDEPARAVSPRRAAAPASATQDQLKKAEAPAAPPPPPPAVAEARQNRVETQTAPGAVAGQLNRPQALAAPLAARAKAAAPPLAFEYVLEDEYITFKFQSDGYFSMHFSPGNDTIVGSHVSAGQTRREYIPNNSTEADIVFSASPQATSGGVSLLRETRTGTVQDPSHERIELLLKFYP